MPDKPKYLSKDGLLYYWTAIKNLLAGKVDKETGKGLSTNDYSTTEKDKLNNIAAGAQVNVIQVVKVNGTAQGITSKQVNITVPTKTSDLTNDSTYQTSAEVTQAIAAALDTITGFDFQKVNELPVAGEKGIIYLIAHSHDTNDGFDEYIWIDSGYEKLGHTDIDLSGYIETTDTITNAEIDAILAM